MSGVRVEIPPSPAKALAQMTQKKAYLECPGSAVNYCWSAVDGEGELFPTALDWAGARDWQRDAGTELLLDSFVSRRKERRNDFGENPHISSFHFDRVPTYKGEQGLYNNEIPERSRPPENLRLPVQSG